MQQIPLYRLNGDERHIRAARAWFETDEAERRAFEPGSGLMVLRNMSIRLDQLAAEDGDEVLQG